MREIKFRGKRIKTGEWVYGFYCYSPVQKEHKIISYVNDDLLNLANAIYQNKRRKTLIQKTYIVDPKSVGQYIDIKDSKEKEIYEGDIIKCGKSIVKVEWDNLIDQDFYWGNASGFVFNFEPDLMENNQDFEIIGNMTDNPELLK